MTETEPLIVFDKYEVIRRLAMGGMGEIFLARQTGVAGFNRLAILKSLLPDLAEDEELLEQFLDEARIAANLNHPNIVGIYEIGEWEGVYFLAMEYIHGESLAGLARAARGNKVGVPWDVTARIVHDTAIGLDHAHHAVDANGAPLNIIHRDVTPQNVMVRLDGVVKVVDFGIAKAAGSAQRTNAGEVKGKLQYMAPEQIRGEKFDHRSDQFSLGVVLWELSTGRRLFPGDSPVDIFRKILTHDVAKPSSVVPGYPSELEAIVMRMLEDKPEERYARCADAAADLNKWLESRPSSGNTVADFVREHVGDEVEKRTVDLTPKPTVIQGLQLTRRICPACGHRNKTKAKFCAECGANMTGDTGPLPTPGAFPAHGTPGGTPAPHNPFAQMPPNSPATPPPFAAPGTPSPTPAPFPAATPPHTSPTSDSSSSGPAAAAPGFDSIFGGESGAPAPLLDDTPAESVFGQDTVLDRIDAALDVHDGAPLLLVGGAGSGRSHLAREAYRRARQSGMRTLWAEGRALGSAAQLDLVRQLFFDMARDEQPGVSPANVSFEELIADANLDDEVTARVMRRIFGRPLPSGIEPDAVKDQRAVMEVILQRAGGTGVAIVVDDLDQGDAASIDILQCAEHTRGTRDVTLIATARSVPVGYDNTVDIAPLDDDAVGALWAEHLGGGGVPASARPRLLEKVRGNPLFAKELVDSLVAQDALQNVQGSFIATDRFNDLTLPQSVTFLITTRYHQLPVVARNLLLTASVAGDVFDLDLVVQAARLGKKTADAVNACVDAKFIARLDGPTETYRFTQVTTRDVIAGMSYAAEIQQAHKGIAEVLEKRAAADPAVTVIEQIARHALAGDPANCLPHVRAAAIRLADHGDEVAAATYYPAVVSMTVEQVARESVPDPLSVREVYKLMDAAIDIMSTSGSRDTAHVVAQALRRLSPTLVTDERGRMYRRLAQLQLDSNNVREAEAALDAALELLEDDDVEGRSQILAELAQVMDKDGDLVGATTQLIESIKAVEGRELKDNDLLWRRMLQLGNLYMKQGEPARARGAFQKARSLASAASSLHGQAQSAARAAEAEGAAGNVVAAEEQFTAGVDLASYAGDLLLEAQTRLKYGQFLLARGKQEEGLRILEGAVPLARDAGWRDGVNSIERALQAFRR